MGRAILFVTDYGAEGSYVGLCHLVVERVAPGTRVIDVSHTVPPGDVEAGALVLEEAVRYGPVDPVVLGVVDPGVGTARRSVAIRAGHAWLIGPDNGLLSLAWDALGGAREVWELDPRRVADWPTSATFHGRDVFAPAAARLAAGAAPSSVGNRVGTEGLIRVERPRAELGNRRLLAPVLEVDRFGNLRLAATEVDLDASGLGGLERLEVAAGDRTAEARRGRTFADAPSGELVLIVDSAGWLAVARNGGDAAGALGTPSRVELRAPGVG